MSEWQFRAGCRMCECGNDRALTEATVDQQRAWTVELGRRDPQFLRIISTNVDDGQGEYEIRSSTTGKIFKRTFTFEGERIITPRFAPPQNAVTTAEDYNNPYAADLAKLRAAAATPLSTFEDQFKAARLHDVEKTRAALDAKEPQPRITAAELAEYAPPDPYKAGLDKMRSEGR
jgi:hypothetical protein